MENNSNNNQTTPVDLSTQAARLQALLEGFKLTLPAWRESGKFIYYNKTVDKVLTSEGYQFDINRLAQNNWDLLGGGAQLELVAYGVPITSATKGSSLLRLYLPPQFKGKRVDVTVKISENQKPVKNANLNLTGD